MTNFSKTEQLLEYYLEVENLASKL